MDQGWERMVIAVMVRMFLFGVVRKAVRKRVVVEKLRTVRGRMRGRKKCDFTWHGMGYWSTLLIRSALIKLGIKHFLAGGVFTFGDVYFKLQNW